jgi:hypothetical protein
VSGSDEYIRNDMVDHGSERLDLLDVTNDRDPFVIIVVIVIVVIVRRAEGRIATVVLAIDTATDVTSFSSPPTHGGDIRE